MIIVLNGSRNSGKSTVANEIIKLLPNTAHVEVDSLRHFVSWMPLEQSIPINIKNAASVTSNFHLIGLNVIVTYPFSQSDFNNFESQLDIDHQTIHIFLLRPALEAALTDRGTRKIDEAERQRIKEHYLPGALDVEQAVEIDNTNETPHQTAIKILRLITAIK